MIVCGAGYWIYTYFRAAPDTGGSAYVDPDASAWDDGLDGPDEIEEKILIPGYSGAQINAGDTKLKLSIYLKLRKYTTKKNVMLDILRQYHSDGAGERR